jgi:phage-related holin
MKDYVTGLLLSTLAVFAPIKALLLVTGILIFSDLISGILAARKKGQKISSAGMRRTITKVAVYNAAIMLGFLTEKYMLDGFLPLSKIASGLISVVEFKSILENLDSINGNPIFKSLIEKLGSINDDKKPGE